ncbi:MAG: hypothetical protein NTY12_03545 [Candidatus Falkowbacteria bacterium]|nr:hypothetical protein [Candidatus Falkowbacteria bacterium]
MKYNYLKLSFYLSLAGTLFAGYMSGVKLFTHTCAFNETCPYFMGIPACWPGLAMFFIMFIMTILGLSKKVSEFAVRKTLSFVSLLGVIFAGRYVVEEMFLLIKQGYSRYALGLPTCTYGLIFYIIIFSISICCCKDCCKK